MDLLGDIGQADQLTTVRAENAVLHQKVKDLSAQCQALKLENATLQAEVELYRQEHQAAGSVSATTSALSQLSVTGTSRGGAAAMSISKPHAFLQSSGDNANESLYCSMPELIFANCLPPGGVNPVCTIMSDDGTLLISGAANGELTVVQWGAYHTSTSIASAEHEPFVVESLAVTESSSGAAATTKYVATVMLDAPVVCISSLQQMPNLNRNDTTLIAAGLMDGRVVLVTCTTRPVLHLSVLATADATTTTTTGRHAKYVTAVALAKQQVSTSTLSTSQTVPANDDTILLMSSSADGTLHISHVSVTADVIVLDSQDDAAGPNYQINVRHVQSFYHQDAITCLCYCNDTIYIYVRGTPHLTCIAVPPPITPPSSNRTDHTTTTATTSSNNDYIVTTLHLNAHALDDHVSFAVLCLQASPPKNGTSGTLHRRYLAAATDSGRHIIIDTMTNAIVQNLYGHDADVYSSPKLAWSRNGQYIYCNTQHDAKLVVYNIASGQQITTLPKTSPHVRPIKDVYSSPHTDMVVTTSFDRNVVIWFPQQQPSL